MTKEGLQGECTDEQIQQLIKLGVPKMSADGKVRDYPAIEEATGVNYNRGWLIIRRAWLEKHEPDKLVNMTTLIQGRQKAQEEVHANLLKQAKLAKGTEATRLEKAAENARYDFYRHGAGPIITDLRNAQISWGEMSVRTNWPESTCRNVWRKVNPQKDKGLRIGKGGRFAYGDPQLYLDNRRKEGAHVPADFKARPKPEDLLNYKAPESMARGKVAGKPKAAAPAKKAAAAPAGVAKRPAKKATAA